MITPSTSTRATRFPPSDGTPGSPKTRTPSTTAKQPAKTSAVTPSARTSLPLISVGYLSGLVVVVAVVAVAVASLPAAAPAPVLLFLHNRHVGRQVSEREPDPPLVGLDPDHLHRELVAELHDVLGCRHRPARHLRDVEQAVDARLELDEGAELGQPDHLALHVRPDRELAGHVLPRVALELLETQRDPLVLLVDVEDDRLDRLPLLQELRGMGHVPRPRHVGDVEEAVDPRLELHEGPEVREVAHLPLHLHARPEPLLDRVPRIGLDLLHAERDPLLPLIDRQDHDLDVVANVDELGRVSHPAGPRHLRDVHQSLDAAIQLHEGPVVRQAHHLALVAAAHGEALGHRLPRVGALLLVPERDPAGLLVEVEDDHVELVA